jgi:hypothetical protein
MIFPQSIGFCSPKEDWWEGEGDPELRGRWDGGEGELVGMLSSRGARRRV